MNRSSLSRAMPLWPTLVLTALIGCGGADGESAPAVGDGGGGGAGLDGQGAGTSTDGGGSAAGGGGAAPTVPVEVDCELLGCVDVTDHGADPTGVQVSTEALQSAIDHALTERLFVYFPTGIYLVDDTLRCMETSATDTGHHEVVGCMLIGSTQGPRPVLQLVDDCPGFDDDSVSDAVVQNGVVVTRPTVKPVVHLWRQQAQDNGGSTDPELHDGSRNYHQVIRNLDVDLGANNPGAVGIRHNGAEGSSILEVRIDARDGFSGLYSFPSSGGITVDIEVVGGRYGVYAPSVRGGASVIVGLRLSGQRELPFLYKGQYPVTIAGFEVSSDSGPLFEQRNAWHDSGGHLALIDGTLELTSAGGTPALQNTDRSTYLKNVYAKGAATIVRNSGDGSTLAAPSASSWTRVDEYSYTAGAGFVDAMVDGVATKQTVAELSSAAGPPPTDLIARHAYPQHLCTFEDHAAVNVRDFGAVGDGATDDTAALKAAIAAGDKVLLPKGVYLVSETIELGPSTQLCGMGGALSKIAASPAWSESSATPLVRTVDDPGATTAIDSVVLRTVAAEQRIYQLQWRAGRDSVVKNVTQNARGPWPGASDIPHARGIISDSGGGRWYGYLQGTSWDCMDELCRQMLIDGTSEPLAFYMYHHQYLRV
ncbi:MAG: hypothetical protein JRI55_33865, partial [Deltaproteobacteria bacterium]|nr:hypothetical protein [Deltaproteobacteria bacterium]